MTRKGFIFFCVGYHSHPAVKSRCLNARLESSLSSTKPSTYSEYKYQDFYYAIYLTTVLMLLSKCTHEVCLDINLADELSMDSRK